MLIDEKAKEAQIVDQINARYSASSAPNRAASDQAHGKASTTDEERKKWISVIENNSNLKKGQVRFKCILWKSSKRNAFIFKCYYYFTENLYR